MRRLLTVACATAALAGPVPTAAASGGRLVRTCADRSDATFPGAYRDPGNIVIGPLAWLWANEQDDDGAYNGAYRWKVPVLVRPRHTVTLRIAAAAQDFAGLSFAARGWDYADSNRTLVFRSCRSRRPTFFAGGVSSTRALGCLPVEIRIDRGAVRRRVLSLAGADC